ncbi:mucin-2-like [Daktulosphaira vitifoliae]|uniref:mucin-2-like n=1 Tax=Daktulosphaira vitifoliae TaxID=58002 RepID=UPI0021AA283C|nr:mucin-2-like [Daktulosphaira vitifoliae]
MSLGSNVLMIGTWLMALNFSNPLPFVTLAINLWKTYILLWSGATAYTIYSDSAYNDGILCVNGRCVSSLFIVNYKAPQVKNNQKTRLDSRTPPLVETTTKSNVGTTRKFSTKRQIELIVPSQGHYTIRIRSTTKKPSIPKITTKKLTTITPRGYNTSIQTTPPKIRPTPKFTSMATVIRSKTTIISVNSFTTPNLSLKPNITTQLIFNTSTNVIPEYIHKNSTNSGLSTEATLQTSTEIQTITAITPKTETFITMTTLKPTTKSITTLEPLTKVTTTIMTSTINPITITPHKKSTPLPPKTTIKKTTNIKKTTKSITSSHKTKNKTTLISTSATTLKPITTTPHKISTFLPSKTTQIKTTFDIKETPPIIPTFKPYDPTDPCDCNITIPEVSSTHHTETTEVYDPDCDCGITNKKLNLQYQSTKHSMR